MPFTLEREIKLRFESAQTARRAILSCGAVPLRPRRLQRDYLMDTPDGHLRADRSVLRVRIEADGSWLTFKGPLQPAPMKLRDEVETMIADGTAARAILERAGLCVWFQYEKYREEFAAPDVTIALDETPVGVFVELEGAERGVAETAARLGCGPGDYVLDSYRSLFLKYCDARGREAGDMLFEER